MPITKKIPDVRGAAGTVFQAVTIFKYVRMKEGEEGEGEELTALASFVFRHYSGKLFPSSRSTL